MTIPQSATNIDEYAFGDCGCNMESIVVDANNSYYDSRNNCNAVIRKSDMKLLLGCKNTVIPSGVKTIGRWAFIRCVDLESIDFPTSLIEIGDAAFSGCSNISSITIPYNVKTISGNAFYGCGGLQSIKVDVNNPYYDSRNDCNAIIKKTDNSLIRGCTNTVIPEGIASLAFSSFSGIKELNSIHLPQSIKTIGLYAFAECSSLPSIELPQNLISIDQGAFEHCSNLSSIIIPSTVTSIGLMVFYYCSKLSLVESKIEIPFDIGGDCFSHIATDAILKVPKGTKNKYNNYPNWVSKFKEIVEETGYYPLSIKSTGNGYATYNGTSVRNNTSTFNVEEGASATITFTPDNGNRIKSMKVNNADVTSSISNNSYTISNISSDTSVDVEFEVIPSTTYTLFIKATGNGYASYNGTSIRGKTSSFTVEKGTSATITFAPDNYNRIKSVKVNNTDVTSGVTNKTYTISSITEDTSVEVAFEAIPTYTLKITSVGNGVASYNGMAVRAKTSSFTVYEGMEATVVFTPDNGYRIASVKVNNQDVTAGVNNNRYTINSITSNTTMSVTFEEIPPTTYSLSITATGNGSVTYNNTTLKNQTQTFTVVEGSYATIAISPESGYRIKSVVQNGVDKTAAVDNNQFVTSRITGNMAVEVEFEVIPNPTYMLSITASGNGTANYLGTAIKNKTQSFSVEKSALVSVTFNPEDGNSVDKVVVNGENVTAKITGNRYVIKSMSQNTTVEVTFMEDINALTVDGVNYSVTSQTSRTVIVVGGNYGKVLEVPTSVTQNGIEWRVMGIEDSALSNNSELTAIIWNPMVAFTASVSNPNLLLYVKDAQYAPTTIHNVVVNGNANDIVLTDAGSGNNFYCPQAFTAQHISYTHNYQMQTGVDDVKGWETIVLPYDVQTVSHEVKGTIKPFAAWNSGDSEKPFWLYELTGSGFVPINSIKAYTPYIISMPNNPQYNSEWQLNGNVTFAASSVTIEKTEDVQKPSFKDRTFIPCFETKGAGEGLYALNVRNLYESNNSGMPDGSMFVLNMRKIHPFEAYLTTSSMARQFIGIFDDMTTDIPMMEFIKILSKETVYDLQGRKTTHTNKKGVYIVNGKKIIK